jgi:hypothetical protein
MYQFLDLSYRNNIFLKTVKKIMKWYILDKCEKLKKTIKIPSTQKKCSILLWDINENMWKENDLLKYKICGKLIY